MRGTALGGLEYRLETKVKATISIHHKELELGKMYFRKADPITKTPTTQGYGRETGWPPQGVGRKKKKS